MFKFTFKKIPKLAKWFYFFGFIILIIAMLLFFYFPNKIESIRMQQLFILGAIIVAIGSIINTIHQFKFTKKD